MKIGLVLSGGGSRGVAHIGVIKALEEHGIVPSHIAGSSAGAIVGALYAYGYDWKAMYRFFKEIQILDIMKYALGKPGFIDAEKFYPKLNEYIKEDSFNSLQKKLVVTATDILRGEPEVFTKGELIRPLLASAAFPGVFAPVRINDSYYIDGGALNNFPVDVIASDCDFIIGSYVNGVDVISIKDLKHSHNVVERAFKLKSVKEDYAKFKYCNLVVSPKKLSKYGTFDRKHLKEILELGYNSTLDLITNETMSTIGMLQKAAQN